MMQLPPFVDVHSHVVPSGDDGAASLDEALELCRMAFAAGTRVLFATPHAHAEWDSYPRTDERQRAYDAAFPVIRAQVAEWGLDLRSGWEVFPTVLEDGGDPAEYRLAGTSAVLLEFPGWWLEHPDPIPTIVEAGERVEAAGLTPVLAHPERCPAVSDDPSVVRPLAERGWLLCLNAPSLLGRHGSTALATAWRLLDDGLIALAASDAHGAQRPPMLDDAFRTVAERYGVEAARPLFDGSSLPWSD